MSKKKKPEELTDDEAFTKLFPKVVKREVEQEIPEKRDRPKKPVSRSKSKKSKQ